MNSITIDRIAAARAVIARLLARANGGVAPERIVLHVREEADVMLAAADLPPGRDSLLVTLAADGRLNVTVGIATHWGHMKHPNFRFARTPSDLLILRGEHRGLSMHFYVDEGRLYADRGSPLVGVRADTAAMRAFDCEFAALMAEAR
jgi:hypothetical protein